jgi:predicted dehydrogenase
MERIEVPRASTKSKTSPARASRRRRKIRVGFIGAGGIARHHYRQLLATNQAEVVALCDPSKESLARFVEQFPETASLPTFKSHRKMLDAVEMDAVEIHSPHTLHFRQAMDALDHGLHLLVEKPMVCRVTHARQLLAKAQAKRKVLLVSYQRHFGGAYRYVREAIAAGRIGPVHFVSATQAQNWLPITHTWRGDPKLSGGGQLNDSGSHLVDIVLWMTGLKPAEVFSYQENMGARVDILSAVSVRFSNGALGTFSVVGSTPQGFYEQIQIWGKKGVFIIGPGLIYEHDGQREDLSAQAVNEGNPDQNFVDAILGKAEVEAPGTCGLRVIQLTQAAWDSAKQCAPVKVRG